MPSRSKTFEMLEQAGLQALTEGAELLQCLARPIRRRLRVFEAADFKVFPIARLQNQDELDARAMAERRQRRIRVLVPHSSCSIFFLAVGFIVRLGGFEKQALVRIENSPGPVWLSRQRFKVPRFPGKQPAKSVFSDQAVGHGIDYLAVFGPKSGRSTDH